MQVQIWSLEVLPKGKACVLRIVHSLTRTEEGIQILVLKSDKNYYFSFNQILLLLLLLVSQMAGNVCSKCPLQRQFCGELYLFTPSHWNLLSAVKMCGLQKMRSCFPCVLPFFVLYDFIWGNKLFFSEVTDLNFAYSFHILRMMEAIFAFSYSLKQTIYFCYERFHLSACTGEAS